MTTTGASARPHLRETVTSYKSVTSLARGAATARATWCDHAGESMTRRLSIVNQKGGAGKTTTCVNLAANLAARGKRVLLIDYDPQGNCTQFLGLAHLTEEQGTYGAAEFTMGAERDGAPGLADGFAPQRDILGQEARGGQGRLDLVPATEELAFIE